MRYFIVVTKQEILVISLTDFFDAASRRHNDVSGNNFVPAGQCSAPALCAAHVQQLNCCVKKRQTLLHPSCGHQTAQIPISCGLQDLSCYAASCLPQTNP